MIRALRLALGGGLLALADAVLPKKPSSEPQPLEDLAMVELAMAAERRAECQS